MKIVELRLRAARIGALEEFYGGLLGLPAARLPGGALEVTVGWTRLLFERAEGAAPVYHYAINIPPGRFAAAKAWLAPRAPLLRDAAGRDEFFSEDWNSTGLYYDDPAGNVGELIARHTLPAAPEAPAGPFTAAELLCVSEVGLAAADAAELAGRLSDALGEGTYGSIGESFAPVGDELGLLICVRRGRIWFPDTGRPAFDVPLEATLELGGGRRATLTAPPPAVTG